MESSRAHGDQLSRRRHSGMWNWDVGRGDGPSDIPCAACAAHAQTHVQGRRLLAPPRASSRPPRALVGPSSGPRRALVTAPLHDSCPPGAVQSAPPRAPHRRPGAPRALAAPRGGPSLGRRQCQAACQAACQAKCQAACQAECQARSSCQAWRWHKISEQCSLARDTAWSCNVLFSTLKAPDWPLK